MIANMTQNQGVGGSSSYISEDSGAELNKHEFSAVLRWDWSQGVDLGRFKKMDTKVMIFQVQSCLDVSIPKYKTGLNDDEEEENEHEGRNKSGFRGTKMIKASRMLKVIMYDGTSNFVGFEYEPIGAFDLFYDSSSNALSRCCVKIALYNNPVSKREAYWLTNSNVKILFEGYLCKTLTQTNGEEEAPVAEPPKSSTKYNEIEVTPDILELADKCFDNMSQGTKSTRTTQSVHSSRLEDFIYTNRIGDRNKLNFSSNVNLEEKTTLNAFRSACSNLQKLPQQSFEYDFIRGDGSPSIQAKYGGYERSTSYHSRSYSSDKNKYKSIGSTQSSSSYSNRATHDKPSYQYSSSTQDRSLFEERRPSQDKSSHKYPGFKSALEYDFGTNIQYQTTTQDRYDHQTSQDRPVYQYGGSLSKIKTLGVDKSAVKYKSINYNPNHERNSYLYETGGQPWSTSQYTAATQERRYSQDRIYPRNSYQGTTVIRLKESNTLKFEPLESLSYGQDQKKGNFARKLMEIDSEDKSNKLKPSGKRELETKTEDVAIVDVKKEEVVVEDRVEQLTDAKILTIFADSDNEMDLDEPKVPDINHFFATECNYLQFSYVCYLRRNNAKFGYDSFLKFSQDRFLEKFGDMEINWPNFCKIIDLKCNVDYERDFNSDYRDFKFGFLNHASIVKSDGKSPMSKVFDTLIDNAFMLTRNVWLAIFDDCMSCTFCAFTLDLFHFLSPYEDELTLSMELNSLEGFFLVTESHIQGHKIRILKKYMRRLPSDDMELLSDSINKDYKEVEREYNY